MEHKNVLGMVCGYYLSRFDREAYSRLGFGTQKATHQALGEALGVPAASIKLWRDEFDPIHDNTRQGWHKREMHPSRWRTAEALGALSETELLGLIRRVTKLPLGDMAKELVATISLEAREQEERAFRSRGRTGVLAERAFRDHHANTGEPAPGELKDRRHDQCGFDFEIVVAPKLAPPPTLAIEVKGLAGQTGGVIFTDKEWSTARELGPLYYLALVRNVSHQPKVSLLSDPASNLEGQMRAYTTLQVGWSVGERVIRTVMPSVV